jgi:hypothetical protein
MQISLIMAGNQDRPDTSDEDDNEDNDDGGEGFHPFDDAPPRKRIRSETGAASSSDPAGSAYPRDHFPYVPAVPPSGFPVPKCPAPGCPPPKTGGHPKAKAKATPTSTPRTPKELSKAPPPLPPKAPQP